MCSIKTPSARSLSASAQSSQVKSSQSKSSQACLKADDVEAVEDGGGGVVSALNLWCVQCAGPLLCDLKKMRTTANGSHAAHAYSALWLHEIQTYQTRTGPFTVWQLDSADYAEECQMPRAAVAVANRSYVACLY